MILEQIQAKAEKERLVRMIHAYQMYGKHFYTVEELQTKSLKKLREIYDKVVKNV